MYINLLKLLSFIWHCSGLYNFPAMLKSLSGQAEEAGIPKIEPI